MVSVDSIPRSRYIEFLNTRCEREIIVETHRILELNEWRKCGIRLRV